MRATSDAFGGLSFVTSQWSALVLHAANAMYGDFTPREVYGDLLTL